MSFQENENDARPVGRRAIKFITTSCLLSFSLLFLGSSGGLGSPAQAQAQAQAQESMIETSTTSTTTTATTTTKRDLITSNEKLIDYAVGTVNTQYYDISGGAYFNPKDFYAQWKRLQHVVDEEEEEDSSTTPNAHRRRRHSTSPTTASTATTTTTTNNNNNNDSIPPKRALQLDTREGTVEALKWLVKSLNDPYSTYMTREELQHEYHGPHDGFLGTGAFVDVPTSRVSNSRFVTYDDVIAGHDGGGSSNSGSSSTNLVTSKRSYTPVGRISSSSSSSSHQQQRWLSSTKVANLPVVTAIAPNSPAERAGVVVGDRIVAVGDRDFLGWTRRDVAKTLHSRYNAETYLGVADLTIAKPVYYSVMSSSSSSTTTTVEYQQRSSIRHVVDGSANSDNNERNALLEASTSSSSVVSPREVVLGYRATKVRLPTKATEPSFLAWPKESSALVGSTVAGAQTGTGYGDTVVQYELLTSSSGSIFDHDHSNDVGPDDYKVGYVRLTRFSKLSTAGFIQAVDALESAGAQSFIIDLRNNYGGIIQEAMLTASSLLRDPHSILCYTLNARGGFTPVDVEQYVVDPRYPGYLLSKEPKSIVLQQLQREYPNMFHKKTGEIDWDPPSSYASIHENIKKRGIRRISYVNDRTGYDRILNRELTNRKDLVVLINEGTASSAEFFTAALHDNGRTVAVVGTKSFGKGLIQHTFPMPDGGGLKLTVGEFLRPSLQHVTKVFDARFDRETGEFVGGGIRPDVYCDSKQGIPGKPKADLCVGVALDILEETAETRASSSSSTTTITFQN
jgi:C-terminal processing protease CtpA/Prc